MCRNRVAGVAAFLLAAGGGLLALVAVVQVAQSAETLPWEVTLNSGRIVRGVIDARSNATHLHLRSGTPAMRIVRPIAWEAIVAARRGQEHWTAAELQADWPRLASPAPRLEARPVPSPSDLPPPLAAPAVDRTVVGIDVDIHAANWDLDVETDGLVVEVMLLNRAGERVSAEVTLAADLIAAHSIDFSARPRDQGLAIEPIGRWSLLVRAGDFHDGVARVRLPYQAIHPEWDMSVATHGLVQLRIGVPGIGVWNRAYDGIRLRPYAPTRDAMERITGQRGFEGAGFGP